MTRTRGTVRADRIPTKPVPYRPPSIGEVDAPPFARDRNDLACAQPDVDPEWFWPIGHTGDFYLDQLERVRAICYSCPALLPCRQHAIDLPERDGIWGGMTPEERKRHSRNRVEVVIANG